MKRLVIFTGHLGAHRSRGGCVSKLTIRKATHDDIDLLVMAHLSSEGDTRVAASSAEQQEHRHKIAAFVREAEHKAAWIYEDTEHSRFLGMVLCRWRTRPLPGVEEYSGDSVFSELADDLFPQDRRFCEIFHLWIDPAYRRRGLATRLKEHLEGECRRRGIGMLYTHTEETNLHVLALNLRLGYQPVRRGPIWDDVMRISLVKRLRD